MEIIGTEFYDDGYLGETIIKCDCGFEFVIKMASIGDVIECPKCRVSGTIQSTVRVFVKK